MSSTNTLSKEDPMSESTTLIHEIILQNFLSSEFPVNVWICSLNPLVPPLHSQLWENGTHYVEDTNPLNRRVGTRTEFSLIAPGLTVPITETWCIKPLQVPPILSPETRIIRVVVRNFIDNDNEG